MTDIPAMQVELSALRATLESELKRIDQLNTAQKEGVSVALIATEKTMNAVLAAADRAADKVESTTRESFAKVNEFRNALDDLGKTMATRRELEDFKTEARRLIEDITARITAIGSRIDTSPELHALTQRADILQGKSGGIGTTITFMQGLVLLVIALIGAYATLRGLPTS